MNEWGKRTIEIIGEGMYLDRLHEIYPHEDGERVFNQGNEDRIRDLYNEEDQTNLIKFLATVEKFPYKESYIDLIRRRISFTETNPITMARIGRMLTELGIENVISGVNAPKEANQRRGPSFTTWIRTKYPVLPLDLFIRNNEGICLLGGSEEDGLNFCINTLRITIAKRPDLIAKVDSTYVVGEAKFASSLGGNQNTGFEDGINLASNTHGNAHKVFIFDGSYWLSPCSAQYRRIDATNIPVFSALVLEDYLSSLH